MIIETIMRAMLVYGTYAAINKARSMYYQRIAQGALSEEQKERLWITMKAGQIAASRKRRAEHVFAIAMTCNMEAAKTEAHHRFLHDLHEEFIVAQGQGNAEDINKLVDKLAAARIFTGRLPILTDAEITAQMVDLTPA